MNPPWEQKETLELYEKEDLVAHVLWLYRYIEELDKKLEAAHGSILEEYRVVWKKRIDEAEASRDELAKLVGIR